MAKITKKQKLKKVVKEVTTKELGRKYSTTYKDIKTYFRLINDVVFNGALNPFNEILIKDLTRQKCIGQVTHVEWKGRGTSQFHLEMDRHYKNKREFLDTLAHEMIHLYQMAEARDTGNHNSLFYSFRPKLNAVGLDI